MTYLYRTSLPGVHSSFTLLIEEMYLAFNKFSTEDLRLSTDKLKKCVSQHIEFRDISPRTYLYAECGPRIEFKPVFSFGLKYPFSWNGLIPHHGALSIR